jgi:uncharacterized protein YciI
MRTARPFVTALVVLCLSAFTVAQEKTAAKATSKTKSGKTTAHAPVKEKQWIYRIQPSRTEMLKSGPTPEEAAAIGAHFNYLKDLTAKGVVIIAGRTLTDDEKSFGIIVFRAPDEEGARKIMNGDPAVEKGVMKAEVFPFTVALQGK